MNQTQKNIAEYKEKLPRLKEKLIAIALLFAMTTAMLVTVTFAWVSLSLNPQVSDINTVIASNGNLEIALAQGKLSESSAPGKSEVGDSTKENYLRNLTWGNLVNLNDSRYGLKNLVLRPALLNDTNLIERPLYGPVYDASGRVVDMNTNFGYALWDNFASQFKASDSLGVRAITSMTLGEQGEVNVYNAKLNLAEAANARFQTKYQSLANNEDYMDALAAMMTGYMVQNILKVNSSAGDMISDAKLNRDNLKQFASMYESLISCFQEQAGVYANLLNLQAEINKVGGLSVTAGDILALSYDKTQKTAYKKLIEMGFETYPDSNKTVGIIKDIDNFLADYALIKADLKRINDLINYFGTNKEIYWSKCPTIDGTSTGIRIIDDIINNLTNVGECTITGGEYTNLKIKNVGATAALALKDAGVCETKITNGILYRMDNRSGARIKNPDNDPLELSVEVNVAFMGTQTIRSNVSTSAKDNYFENERALMAKIIKDKYGAPKLIANDSYGFVIDFWVRTNAANSYLTLQGNVLTRTDSIDVKGKDLNGKEVQLYTITIKLEDASEGENTEEEGSGSILDDMMVTSYDVYQSTYVPENQQTEVECWRFADSHQVVTEESLGGQEIPTPLKKVKEVETVIGYEGDNRVWEGSQHSLLTVSSTTQGSGSCYVFSADTPVDQQRSLELLKSMRVAFVDSDGVLLSTAYMDTEHHYSSAGKVIVPIALSSDSINIGADPNGEINYAITALEQNVPKRITAIVYLDGTNLTNANVLASADIEGKMNIQFGSSAVLIPLNSEKLYNSELYAQVEAITPTTFDYDALEDGQKMTSNVKIRVTGTQPQIMTANFIRRINDTQGSPEQSFILTDADGDGVWEGNYTFLYPGNYILRNVTIDGADRDIKIDEGAQYPTVVVNGFSINQVFYSMSDFVMTDADSYTGNVTLEFGTNDPEKMPYTVIGKFMRKDGAAVNVNFSYNPTSGKWHGNANFVSSGEYTMQYVVLDGQYVELASAMQKTVDLTLGMKVKVQTLSPTTIFFGEEAAPKSLKMQVEILDNNNDPVENLAGASLTYTMTGTETLYAGLVYNSGAQHYEGEFPVQSGTWKFSHVTIRIGESSSNSLFKVNSDAPVFTVVPPTPPSYVANNAESVQYVAGDSESAKFTVTLKESGSATVYAKLVNKDDSNNVVYALGVLDSIINDEYNYLFDITESGLWKLECIGVFGIFDSDQKYHATPETIDDESYKTGIVFDSANSDFENREIVVLYQKDIKVSFNYDSSKIVNGYIDNAVVFGKTEGNITGTFMQEYKLANGFVSVKISDKYNLIGEYFNVENVSLSYKYNANGDAFGGYTGGEYSFGECAFKIGFGGKETNFSQSNEVLLTYAAQYTPNELKYSITYLDNKGKDVESAIASNADGAYKIEVYSVKPSAKITGITPTGSNPTKITYTTKNIPWYQGGGTQPTFTVGTNLTSSFDAIANTATLYAVATADNSTQRHGGFTQPKLTLTIAGVGSDCAVSLTLPGGSADAITFSRTGNGTIQKTLGKVSQVKSWTSNIALTHTLSAYYGHGEQTITSMTITKDGVSYNITLDKAIVINNPSSISQ